MSRDISNFVVIASYIGNDRILFGENREGETDIIGYEEENDNFSGYHAYNVYECDKVRVGQREYEVVDGSPVATFVTEEDLLQWMNGE